MQCIREAPNHITQASTSTTKEQPHTSATHIAIHVHATTASTAVAPLRVGILPPPSSYYFLPRRLAGVVRDVPCPVCFCCFSVAVVHLFCHCICNQSWFIDPRVCMHQPYRLACACAVSISICSACQQSADVFWAACLSMLRFRIKVN